MPVTTIRAVLRTLSLALLLLPAAAAADRVLLLNGRVLEDVVVEEAAEGIRVHVGGGVLTLPPGQVLSIEKAPSSVAEFTERAAALRVSSPSAEQWLELARWARTRSYDFGARVAALEAAALEPAGAEVATLLRPLGYERDPDGIWVPYDEAMRRRGWIDWQGEWLPPDVAAAKAEAQAAEREEARRRAAEARAERVAALTEMKLLSDLARPEPPTVLYAPVWSAWGVPVVPVPPVPVPWGSAGAPAFSAERRSPARTTPPPSTRQGVVPGTPASPPG